MAKYIQVIDNVVVSVEPLTELPSFEILGEMVEITGVSPEPSEGWVYDSQTGIFSHPDLTSTKQEQINKIDDVAGNKRKLIDTAIYGQTEIYTLKANEANQYIADGEPADLTNYPWIQAEVTATGLTASEVASTIVSKHDGWITAMSSIERERRLGKVNVENATSYDNVLLSAENAISAIELIAI